MDSRWVGQSRWSILLLVQLFVDVLNADGLAISYCSTDLTASSYSPMWNQWQSIGLCEDHCQGSFAFAVLQGNNCWCSNYVPADQDPTLNCNQGCPGIDTEWCGNTDDGLYGYFLLTGGKALGTSGSGSSTTASSVSTTRSSSSSPAPSFPHDTASSLRYSPGSSSTSLVTSLVTVVPPQSSVQTVAPSTVSSAPPSSTYESPASTYSFTYVPQSSSATAADPKTTASSAESSITSTPIPTEVYTSITTVTGQIRTVIITPTASADATLGQSSTAGGHGVSTGKVVGIVLGVALGIGLIIGILVWLWFRSKRRRDIRELSPEGSFVAERSGGNSSGGNSVPSRQVSQMSTSGLLGKVPRIMTNGLMGGSDLRSADTSGSGFDRRSVGTDQRLNPWAIYTQEERMSNVSLQDNQDYSRQLRVANPDA